jgi:hypothetical protein
MESVNTSTAIKQTDHGLCKVSDFSGSAGNALTAQGEISWPGMSTSNIEDLSSSREHTRALV